jgi:KipI family sensor histidine kinase inhibitor
MSDPVAAADLPRVDPFGDAALLVTLGDRADPALARQAGAMAGAIQAARAGLPAVGRPVPAHATVLVPFDPLEIDPADARAAIVRIVQEAAARDSEADAAADGPAAAAIEIPVRYGGEDGPDLAAVAAAHDLRPADVAELHAAAVHTVLFLGFAPGFAYLGGLPERLVTPRRATPRVRVPAGSVAIAGDHSGVYPRSMPGGWNLIGRTNVALFDPARVPPSRLEPGAVVRFVPAR